MDTIGRVPHFDAATFERLFNNTLQDLLAIIYLMDVTRTQITLADRISAIL